MGGRTFGEAVLERRRTVARETFVLRYRLDWDPRIVPGQFAMVHPGDDARYVLPRPFSILDAGPGWVEILIKVLGRGSRELVEMDPGKGVRIFAPLGHGFDLDTLTGDLVLVAGGVGIVPLHLLARRMKAEGRRPARALFGARTPEDLPRPIFRAEEGTDFELWVEEDAQDGLREGRVTVGLAEALHESPDARILTCGPTAMMQAVARMGRERGHGVWLCLEEQMGCGAGVCRSCVVDDATAGDRKLTVCREGPVFSLSQIRYLPEDRASGEAIVGCGS